MDPIGASCFSLHLDEKEKKLLEEKKQDEKFQEIIASCASLSGYESKKWKTVLPQVLAASHAASFHVVVGIALAYSAILLPQLEDDKREFSYTEVERPWIASIIILANPFGNIFAGFIMDRIGRLNTLKIAAIPAIIGWSLIALSTNVPMLLVGRFISGLGSALGTSPAIVYITEIARADMRGSLISFAPTYASLGMVLAYLFGYLMRWAIVAWLCNAFTIIAIIVVMFIPESPPWLVSKGRYEEASKSLAWIHKFQPQPDNKNETLAEMQLAALKKEHERKQLEASQRDQGIVARMMEFMKPTGYKPLCILFGLFLFQQFSGIYITLFYSVTFFKEVRCEVDPYIASILIGIVRFIMSVVNTYMLKTFRRRPLVMWSCLGMAACMGVSGTFTYLIKRDMITFTWVPLAAILMYVVTSMIGLLAIPWTMTAELFPIEIRGMAHSMSYGMANILMFAAIQSYPGLSKLLNGAEGVQWFFAGCSLAGLVFALIFMPETHAKKLDDIVDYFRYNTIYFGSEQKKKNRTKKPAQIITRPSEKDIIKSKEQSEKLIHSV